MNQEKCKQVYDNYIDLNSKVNEKRSKTENNGGKESTFFSFREKSDKKVEDLKTKREQLIQCLNNNPAFYTNEEIEKLYKQERDGTEIQKKCIEIGYKRKHLKKN